MKEAPKTIKEDKKKREGQYPSWPPTKIPIILTRCEYLEELESKYLCAPEDLLIFV